MVFNVFSPLEQFSIFSLFSFNESYTDMLYTGLVFTNSNIFLVINILVFLFFVKLLNLLNSSTLKPKRFQYILESIYSFVLTTLVESVSGSTSKKYFSWIFFVFITLLIVNVSGMVPYSFTVTSHLIITFWFALGLFSGVTIIGIYINGINFFSLFLPPGVSLNMAPLLVVIEILSYFIRVISLSVRLFANMMSGHILLKVLLGFAWTMMVTNYFLYILHFFPLFIVFLLIGLELGVSVIQSYIFTILLCIYLNDAISLH
jgi:F-type H+-transporting ATPase subunit a